MRGRVNMMDLFDLPFNIVHELYYYTFLIKEEREKERKAEEKKNKEEEAKKSRLEEMNRRKPALFDRRMSPAAQAREVKHNKSQDDEKQKSEGQNKAESVLPPSSSGVDMEDLMDALEEGG